MSALISFKSMHSFRTRVCDTEPWFLLSWQGPYGHECRFSKLKVIDLVITLWSEKSKILTPVNSNNNPVSLIWSFLNWNKISLNDILIDLVSKSKMHHFEVSLRIVLTYPCSVMHWRELSIQLPHNIARKYWERAQRIALKEIQTNTDRKVRFIHHTQLHTTSLWLMFTPRSNSSM